MLPITALPAATGLMPGIDVPATQASSSAEGADFLTILAAQTVEPLPVPLPLKAIAVTQAPTDEAAALLPDSGKILPPALPVLPEALQEQPQKLSVDPATRPEPHPVVLARAVLTRTRATLTEQGPEDAEDTATIPQIEALTPPRESAAVPIPQAPMSLAANESPAPAELTEPTSQHSPATTLAMALPQRAAKPQAKAEPAAQAASELPVLMIETPSAPATPATARLLPDSAPGQSAAALRVKAVAAKEQSANEPAPAGAINEAPAPPMAPSLVSQTATPDAPLAQPAPAARPHDFATLVDRLVAAREAMQPQAVSVAVRHAEFGPVHLHFRHEEAGLSVSLASPDPDFARAVNAAVPPVQAAQASDSTAFQSGSRQDQPASHGDSHGQSRGQPFERRDERDPRANPSPQRGPRQESGPETKHGIFA